MHRSWSSFVVGVLCGSLSLLTWPRHAVADPTTPPVEEIVVPADEPPPSTTDPITQANQDLQQFLFGIDPIDADFLFLDEAPTSAGTYSGYTAAGEFSLYVVASASIDFTGVQLSSADQTSFAALNASAHVVTGVVTHDDRAAWIGGLCLSFDAADGRKNLLLPTTVDLYNEGTVFITSSLATTVTPRNNSGGSIPGPGGGSPGGNAAACAALKKACDDNMDDAIAGAKTALTLCVGPVGAACLAALILYAAFCIASGGAACALGWWFARACGGFLVGCFGNFVSNVLNAWGAHDSCIKRANNDPVCRGTGVTVPM